MELVAGYPYWLIKTGLPYEYPKLRQDLKCTAVIIGGGISGALTAYHCVSAGIDCILLDARSIGLGSTCASTSLLQYELDIPLHRLKKMVGDDRAVRAYKICADAVTRLVDLMKETHFSEYSEALSLYFCRRKRHKKMLYRECIARQQAGFEVEILPGVELRERYGLIAHYAILSRKGALNNAYAFTHHLLQHCISKGLMVFDRTKVKKIECNKDRVMITTVNGQTISSSYAINATGYEAVNFIRRRIVDLHCTYAIVSESQPGPVTAKQNVMMWNTDDPYLYLCPANDNRIIVGGRDERFIGMKPMLRYLDRKSALLQKDFQNLFPAKPFCKEFAWSGVFGTTKDSLPYIGAYPGVPRVLYALGFGGNGITFSLVAAEIIRDLLLGRHNENADVFSFSR